VEVGRAFHSIRGRQVVGEVLDRIEVLRCDIAAGDATTAQPGQPAAVADAPSPEQVPSAALPAAASRLVEETETILARVTDDKFQSPAVSGLPPGSPRGSGGVGALSSGAADSSSEGDPAAGADTADAAAVEFAVVPEAEASKLAGRTEAGGEADAGAEAGAEGGAARGAGGGVLSSIWGALHKSVKAPHQGTGDRPAPYAVPFAGALQGHRQGLAHDLAAGAYPPPIGRARLVTHAELKAWAKAAAEVRRRAAAALATKGFDDDEEEEEEEEGDDGDDGRPSSGERHAWRAAGERASDMRAAGSAWARCKSCGSFMPRDMSAIGDHVALCEEGGAVGPYQVCVQ